MPVILARAFPGEQDEPWSLARSVVREALDADLAVVERLQRPVAGAVAWLLPELEPGTPGPPPDAESRRAMLVEAAVHLLGEAGRVIVIDDVQWADLTSLALVEAVTPSDLKSKATSTSQGSSKEKTATSAETTTPTTKTETEKAAE